MKKQKLGKLLLVTLLILSSIFSFVKLPTINAAQDNNAVISITNYGVSPGGQQDASVAIIKAMDDAKRIREENPDKSITIDFPKGEYQFYPDKAFERTLYVSNTVGADNNYKDKKIGILVENIDNITIEGNDSDFIFHGKMTTFATINSENVSFQNFSVDFAVPTVVDVTVESVEGNTATIYIPKCYNYRVENNSIKWLSDVSPYTKTTYWQGTDKFANGYSQSIDLNTGITTRSNELYNSKISIEDLGNNRVKFTYSNKPASVKVGMCYQMRPTLRDTPGTFFWKTKNINLTNLDIYFLHGFGMVGQTSENITLNDVDFRAPENTGRTTAGYADFIQMSGCKGIIDIQNCYFANPHDDPINVHGTFQQVVAISEDRRQITVRYKHNETAGFPSFAVGDEVEFTKQSNMLPVEDSSRIVKNVISGPTGDSSDVSSLIDTVIELNEPIPQEVSINAYVVENITYTPSLIIKNNIFKQVPTRGVLATTRKPIVIENNIFESMAMAAIYISCDAQSWYESGRVEDLTIKNNKFYRCGETGAPVIFIEPTNPNVSTTNTVHKNIKILNNEFYSNNRNLINAKSVDGIEISGNSINRFNPDIKIELSSLSDTIPVGTSVSLTANASGKTISQNLYSLNGCKNVVIKENTYDNGMKMNVAIANMLQSDVDIQDPQVSFNGSISDTVGKIVFESSNPDIATVSSSGLVKGIKKGQTIITAYSIMNGKKYVSNKQIINVTDGNGEVYPKSLVLTSNGNSIDGINKTMQFNVIVTPENSTNKVVTYQVVDAKTGNSSDVATIDQNGLLTTKKVGVAEVRAVSENGIIASKIITIHDETYSLSERFTIKNDTGRVKIDGISDTLSIYPDGGSLWATGNSAKNIVLLENQKENVTVTVKMTGRTKNGWEESGLVFYKDDDNYTALQRKHANGNPVINVSNEINQSPSEAGLSDVINDVIWLKLEKNRNEIKGYYSIDGVNWIIVRTVENSTLGSDFKIGILNTCGSGVTEIKFNELIINNEKINFASRDVLPVVTNVLSSYDNKTNYLSVVYDSAGSLKSNDIIRWQASLNENGVYSYIEGLKGAFVEVPLEYNGYYFRAVVIPVLDNGTAGDIVTSSQAVKVEIKDDALIKMKAANSKLINVDCDGIDFETFKSDLYNYIASTNKDSINFTFLPEDGARIRIKQNGIDKEVNLIDNNYIFNAKINSGINVIEVYVTGEDEVSTTVYRYTILHFTNEEAIVDNIKINGKTLDDFDKDKYEYVYYVDDLDVNDVMVSADGEGLLTISANGCVIDSDSMQVILDSHETYVTITSKMTNGSKKYYLIKIKKADISNADLEMIENDKFVVLSSDFDAKQTEYKGKVFSKQVSMSFIAAERNATIKVIKNNQTYLSNGNKLEAELPMYKGINEIVIIVLAADQKTTKRYTLLLEAPEVIYLSDLEYKNNSSTGYGEIKKDASVDGNTITLRNEYGQKQVFEKGIGTHATSHLYYDLTGLSLESFSTYFGVDQEITKINEPDMIFHFYVDDNEQDYDGKGETMTGTTTMKYVEFSTKGANKLHLFVDKLVNDWSDHASFGDAKFKTSFEEAPVPTYTLLVNVNDDNLGSVNINPIKEYYFTGEQIELQAVENSNARFVKWIDANGDTLYIQKEYVLTITNNTEITAVFEKVDIVKTDKTALSIALDMAKAVTQEQLDKVVPAVANEFKGALQNAQTVYDNASATQVEVDDAFDRLTSVMHMLEFYKGDKTALQKMADQIANLIAGDYIKSTWDALQAVLPSVNEVLENENAMQEEVDEVYTELVKAFLNLRLKPNKDLLKDLINKANGLNRANYSATSLELVDAKLEKANAVLNDPEATKEEVEAAVSELTKAIAGLEAKPESIVDTSISVKPGDTIAIKTGDDANVYQLVVMLLVGFVLIVFKNKKIIE